MAEVIITIKDIDINNIGVDIETRPQFPESRLLYTNAQMVGEDVINGFSKIAKQVNDTRSQVAVQSVVDQYRQ